MITGRLSDLDIREHIGDRIGIIGITNNVTVRLQKDRVSKMVVFNICDKQLSVEVRLFAASDKMIEYITEGAVYMAIVDVQPYDKSPTGYSCVLYNIERKNTPVDSFLNWANGMRKSRDIINEALIEYYDTVYGQITYSIVIENWDTFCKWAAASSMHHNTLGGLLVHTAEVVSICDRLADFFTSIYGEQFINKPLLICSAILHDFGKIYELNVNTASGKVEYSTHSALSTHIMDILSAVDLQAYKLGILNTEPINTDEQEFSEDIEAVDLLKHCLAAHHGKLEFGSPITAAIPEAVILSKADEISAEMFRFNRDFSTTEPGESSAKWEFGSMSRKYKDTSKASLKSTEVSADDDSISSGQYDIEI